MSISIDERRLERDLEELAAFSESAAPAVTRIVFSEEDLKARAWLKMRCQAAGLSIREDAVGNTFARWNVVGSNDGVVGTGSHIDAIPNAGRYDGTVGVLGALEALRALKHSGFSPKRPLELLLFTSEEPTRFGIGCLGSRLLSGALNAEQAGSLKDREGLFLSEIKEAAGFSGSLASVRSPANYFNAFVELHIEQGPLLEQAHVSLGLVTSIAAPASLQLTLEGEGGHAGAVLMPQRHDALTAGAEIIVAIENLARTTGAIDSVATTGVCEVFPGAVNSIPSRVSLAVDVRDTDLLRRDALVRRIEEAAYKVGVQRSVQIQIQLLNADDPAQCDAQILQTLRESCQAENVTYMEMVSRAYHDSLFMSRIAPTAMLFIPCRAGVSHRPDEFASVPDIVNGVRVLAETLKRLSG